MSDIDKNLSQILETEFTVIPEEGDSAPSLPVAVPQADSQEDFDYSRKNYYDLIERGSIALDGILEVAKESQHPRAYEVAANMMKNLSDMTDKLMILQKQRKDLEGTKTPTHVTVENQAVFIGSTTDLLKRVHDGSKS